MSDHVGYIVQIQKLDKHPNAHSLQIATIFGASVIVDLNTKIGDLGIYFPIDLQLSEEYCEKNNLVRKLDENGNNIGGYLEPNKRNIRAMRFRGSKSEGLFMPLETLVYTGKTQFEVGEKINVVNGYEICKKYIPRGKKISNPRNYNKARKKKVPISPLFAEHADTEQLVYNMDAFLENDMVEITLKMHGTSGRTGYLPVFQGYTSKFPLFNSLARLKTPPTGKAARKLYDIAISHATPVYDWGYVTGTRRVVLDNFEGGFYGDNAFREQHAKFFEGKLNKGETVYYEIVGFTTTGAPIMSSVANNKISDKEFTKQYGKTTTFSYGCKENESACYVYRMTMTNEDGDVVEYPPDYMRYRCEQMGAKYVPILWRGIVPDKLPIVFDMETETDYQETPGDYIKEIAEQYYDGPDPIGKNHVREGVVIRILNRPKFCAYKHKNFSFKVLEGIAKDLAAEPDMEEAQEVLNND